MTEDELRIIAFLEASAAARPAEFPDWMLALLEGDRPEEMTHELITAASLIYARRLRPGIGLDAARAFMAEYAADPARLARARCPAEVRTHEAVPCRASFVGYSPTSMASPRGTSGSAMAPP
jgi:hypothetical protein